MTSYKYVGKTAVISGGSRGLGFPSLNSAAERILARVAHGDAEIIFPSAMKAATWVQAAFPELTGWVTELVAGHL